MEKTSNLTSRIVEKDPTRWRNKHQTVSQQIDRLYDVWNPSGPGANSSEGIIVTVRNLQTLIAGAIRDRVRLRAIGSGWSISNIAATDGRLVNTKPLNWIFRISEQSVSPEYMGDPEELLFVQCGTAVVELNKYLKERGRSLKSSGASNGQTFVGAMSTGTHGSAFEVGAIQECVVGIHLIVGPERHVWLERASDPVVSDEFVGRLGAELLRDDTLFDAALVSFGSFGIIHGVMIETEPAFLLEAFRERVPLDADLRAAIDTLDFSKLSLPRGDETPYHFEVVVNPYDLDSGAYVTTMYKHPYRDSYPTVQTSPGGLGPGDDFLHVIGVFSDEVPELVPALVNSIFGSAYHTYTSKWGTLGEIFGSTSIRGKSTGSALGLPLQRASEALDAVLSINSAHGPFGGVFALRFVKRSDALFAFTRFEPTAVLDLDGVHSRRSEAFFRRVWQTFEDMNIPYTLHWGKVNDLDAESVRRMYGGMVDRWIESRNVLLEESAREIFSSPFLDRCNLSDPRPV